MTWGVLIKQSVQLVITVSATQSLRRSTRVLTELITIRLWPHHLTSASSVHLDNTVLRLGQSYLRGRVIRDGTVYLGHGTLNLSTLAMILSQTVHVLLIELEESVCKVHTALKGQMPPYSVTLAITVTVTDWTQ